MKRTILASSLIALGCSLAWASAAQAHSHSKMDHSKMDHSKMDHSKMDHSKMDHSEMDHSQMDHSKMDHQTMDHSTMDHSKLDHSTHAVQAPPVTPIPPLTDADRAVAFPDVVPHHMADNAVHSYMQLNRLETWDADRGGALAWQGSGWIGTDLNRIWLRSEGERIDGRTRHADLEVLYGHSVAPWWDLVVGLRQDFRPGPSQTWAAFGVQGLAPYKFEVQATAYVGESGQTAARFEIDYETLITNRLILQPVVEANFHGQNDARRGIGSGLSTIEAGFRLRYEFHRQFAPYIGLTHARAFGRTADFRREAGESRGETQLVAGLRLWF